MHNEQYIWQETTTSALYMRKLRLVAWPFHFCDKMSTTLQINDEFRNVIIHSGVISCAICISNKVEYSEKEES